MLCASIAGTDFTRSPRGPTFPFLALAIPENGFCWISSCSEGVSGSGLALLGLILEPVSCAKHPPHDGKAQAQEHERDGQADSDAHVRHAIEAPTEGADEV